MTDSKTLSNENNPCLDPNWINMPIGLSWNKQKLDYCTRASIVSPFYVNIIGLYWHAATNNSGNYGVDYSKCCVEENIITTDNPCPPTDPYSPFYQYINSPLGSPHDFCNSDYCLSSTPHSDCVCCPEDHDPGNGDPVDDEIKFIKKFDINTKTIPMEGSTLPFEIIGDEGAKFELEVKSSADEYYSFRDNTLGTTRTVLTKTIQGSSYSGNIVFPRLASGDLTWTLTLRAVTDGCAKTQHVAYEEVRFGDDVNIGPVDGNSSIGSTGVNLTKTIKQGPAITWTITPTSGTGTSTWTSVTMATQSISTVANGSIKTSFSISATPPANSAIKKDTEPKVGDFFVTTTTTIGAHKDAELVSQFGATDLSFDGKPRSGVQLVGASGGVSGARNIDMASDIGETPLWAIGDRITGNTEIDAKIVTISAVEVGGDASLIQASENVTIANGESLEFTPPRHYKWPAANIVGLKPGMNILETLNGGGSIIGAFTRTMINPTYIEEDCGFELVNKSQIISNEPAIKPTGPATFNSDGEITSQAGDIIFEESIGAEFTAASYKFQGYGIDLIESVSGASGVKITNLKVNDGEDFSVTTTVNDASATGSASLSDFDVTSKNGIMDDVSTVRGINITSSAADPTVSAIASSTGKNITVTPGGHLLENGQSITFDGATTAVRITGDIEIADAGTSSRSLFLDLDKFLTYKTNT
jgi:hypothetical protein